MPSPEEKDPRLDFLFAGNLESPFLEEELFVRETEAEWEPHLEALQSESPFQSAFDQDRTTSVEPELEEEFVEEEEWSDENDLLADEAEVRDEEALSDFQDEEDVSYSEGEEEAFSEEAVAPEEERLISQENWIESEEEEDAYPLEEAAYGKERSELDEESFVEPKEGKVEAEKSSDITTPLEEAFLDELDEEDDYVLFETEMQPPPLKVTKRALTVPTSNPVPFAPAPPLGSYWPIITSIQQGREVNYLAVDHQHVGSRRSRRFLASRSAGARQHVGIDLFANFNDPVCACQDGEIVNFYGFCCGDKKTTYALLVQHASVVVNYGEVAPNSLERTGRKVGSQVRAGDVIGFIGRNPGGSSMLHFETYTRGTRRNASWQAGKSRPAELLNPTGYLLFLSEFGLVGRVMSASPSLTPTPKPSQVVTKPPAELVQFAQRVLNAAEGEQLDDDGDLGRLTREALERFRKKYNLGAGGVLDAKTELALAQRALEEIAQQSLFAQPGLRDAKTDQALKTFKTERGLGSDPTLNAATRAALTDALARRRLSPSASLPSQSQRSPNGLASSRLPSGSTNLTTKAAKDVTFKAGKWEGWKGRQTVATAFIHQTTNIINDKYDVAVAVAAKVEANGAFDKVQMYDNGILSWGIKQWTLHRGSLQGILRFINSKLARSLWTEIFPGINFQNEKILINGTAYAVPQKDGDTADRALRKTFRGKENPEEFDEAKVKYWLTVFATAGRHPNIQKLQFEYAVISLKKNVDKLLGEVLKARNDVKASEVRNYLRVGHYIESSPIALALFNGMETQNPQWTYRYLKRIVDRFAARYGKTYDTSRWPSDWQTKFAQELQTEFEQSRVACWGSKALEKKPACKGRQSRTQKLLDAYNELSRNLAG